MAPVHAAFGVVAVQHGDLKDAELHLAKSAEFSTSLTPPMIGVLVRLGGALVHLARNQLDDAIADLSSARVLFERIVEPERLPLAFYVVWLEAMLLSRVGRPDTAEELLDGIHSRWKSAGEYALARAHVQLGRGSSEVDAIDILRAVMAGTTPARWPIGEIGALLLAARLQRDAGDAEQARATFERGMDVAARTSVMLPLLTPDARRLAIDHPLHATAHGALLAQLAGDSARAPGPRRAPEISEPITESERRVLGYLASNLRPPEIGRHLYLSKNTVKRTRATSTPSSRSTHAARPSAAHAS
jgi:LuxR family transcriptional regulator, maltose regulon positive regulatory protein